jgi:hypothetical protein
MQHSNQCKNKTLCLEKLSLVLPETPPYVPRQFDRCAVIGNSGDLLKTKFGKEIDDYDVVIRENGAPIKVRFLFFSFFFFFCQQSSCFSHLLNLVDMLFFFFLLFCYCRIIQSTWARKVHFVFLTGDLLKPLIKL